MNQLVLAVDRTVSPIDFLGPIYRLDEQDERLAQHAEIVVAEISLLDMSRNEDDLLLGEERLNRLKQGSNLRLDFTVFYGFWTNQHLIPETWKNKIDGKIPNIHFDGSIFKSDERPNEYRYSICLYWHENAWNWYLSGLAAHWPKNNLSAVLAK